KVDDRPAKVQGDGSLRVPVGPRALLLEAPGYQPAERKVAVAASKDPLEIRFPLKRRQPLGGVFGFPQAQAQILRDQAGLRVAAWNNDRYLVVEAVIWGDGDDSLGETDDGRQIGDWSDLTLDLDADQVETPNVDRVYSLNPWPTLPGLRYTVVLGKGV